MKQVVILSFHFFYIPIISAYAFEQDSSPDFRNQIPSAWQIVKDDKLHNIVTYYKQEDGKRYRSFKAEVTYDYSIEAAACHQLDINNYSRWFMNVVESRILKRVSDTEFYMYLRLKAPMNLPDRDVPLHVVLQPYNSKRGEVAISYSSVPDYLPVNRKVVRMPIYESVTRLYQIGGKVQEVTEGYAEPGGRVPNWLVNYFQRQMPYANSLARSRDIARYEGGKASCPFKYKEKE